MFIMLEEEDALWNEFNLDNREEALVRQCENLQKFSEVNFFFFIGQTQLIEYNSNYSKSPGNKEKGNVNEGKKENKYAGNKKGLRMEESVTFFESSVEQGLGNEQSEQSKKSQKKETPPTIPKVNEESKKKSAKPKESDEEKDAEKTEMKGKGKNQQIPEEDEESEKTLKHKPIVKMPPSLQLTYIDEKNVFTNYTFKKTFLINRNKQVDYGVSLFPDKEVSGKHCIVHCIDDMGFFLQDEGSSNYTFIKLNENSNFALKEGMEILMGETIFEVTKLLSDKIQLNATIHYESENPGEKDIEIKFGNTSNDIVFGKNPSAKYTCQFANDENIDDEHGIFRKLHEKFMFSPLKTANRSDYYFSFFFIFFNFC